MCSKTNGLSFSSRETGERTITSAHERHLCAMRFEPCTRRYTSAVATGKCGRRHHARQRTDDRRMCTYNGLPYTQRAIHSIREHSDGPVELIVVDNGSTDGTTEWLATQQDIRTVVLGENLGVSTARNRGLELAHGAHIVFCDNDVLFTRNGVQLLNTSTHGQISVPLDRLPKDVVSSSDYGPRGHQTMGCRACTLIPINIDTPIL